MNRKPQLNASNKRYIYSMKNILIILCLLFISATGSAQKFNIFKGDTINRTDAKGLKQGIWKKYYSNDVLFSEGVYKDGKHTGTFKTFYKSGKPQSILKFRGMSEINDAEIFSEDSGLMAKGKYIDRIKDSLWVYYDRMGKKSSEEFYIKGKKEGELKLFYPNGQLSRTVIYKKDIQNGVYKEFFMDGTPKVSGVMKNGGFEGLLTIFHPNGKVWQKGIYKNGLKEGKWQNYSENGVLESEDEYKKGVWLNPTTDDKGPIEVKEPNEQ
ncbi:MAG: toxin-antitoxin system YwqK family antitoxin [Bacteroidetes bacterium]|nr:toxin-antitoxin system YwqK family antitoxin [Bacteroidota bacterium]